MNIPNSSLRLTDGEPEPIEIKNQIISRCSGNIKTGYTECIKTETIQYIKKCDEDNFCSFIADISSRCDECYTGLIYEIQSIKELETVSVNPFNLNFEINDNKLFIKKIANIRDLKALKYLSTLEDIYQFVFVMQYCLIKDDIRCNSFEDRLELAYKNMPSHFYMAYIDEGGIENPCMRVIFSEMLSGNINYKQHILNYAKKTFSIVDTARNDVGDILFQSVTPLEYIDSSLKSDAEFVKELINIDISLLQYMHNSIKNNKELVLYAYNIYVNYPGFDINYCSGYFHNSLYQHYIRGIGDELMQNKPFMMSVPELVFNKEDYLKEMDQKRLNSDDEDLPF